MATVGARGGEEILIGAHGAGVIRLVVADPDFGPIAALGLDHRQAALLATALDEQLVAAAGGTPASPDL